MFYLTTHPLWISALLLVVGGTTVSMFGPGIVRRRITVSRLSTNNEVAGFKFAAIGTLYAVMLAFAVIVVWEKFNDANTAVAQEESAAVNVYRLSGGLGAEAGPAIREKLSEYLRAAIDQDWPAMQDGRSSEVARHSLNALYAVLMKVSPRNERESVLFAEILHQTDDMTEARRARISLAAGIIPGIVWMVLVLGAFVTIGFTFFFGTQNLRAQP